jgi:hypothetical protein
VIDKLKKTKSFDNGGITRLPMPPSSPNVPAVYNREPLFSVKGLQQRYAGLPGAVRKPLGMMGRTGAFLVGGRLAPVFGGIAIGQGFDALARATNTPEEYEAMKEKARAQGGVGYFEDVNISQDASGKSQLEKDFPGMSGSEIIEQINKSEQDSGIEINPNEVGEVINQTIEKNQLDGLDVKKPDGPNEKKPKIDETDTIELTDDQIITEVNNRKNQKKKAKQFYFENQIDFLNSNNNQRSAMALQLDNTIDDIMGEKSSNKLLLLQLASNLLSGRTDQPGFKGFLDVLGQAGQNVIPMAIALEQERRDDENELRKALIANMGEKNKLSKYSPDNKIVKVRFPGNTEFETFRARTSENGAVEVKIPDAAEGEDAYVDVRNFDYKIIDAPEAKDIERINKGISVKARALRGLNNALKLTMNDPQLIGSPGTIQSVFLQAGDILKSYLKQSTYDQISSGAREARQQFSDDVNARIESGEITEEQGAEEIKQANREGGFFSTLADQMNVMGGDASTTLQQQAALKATELLTSYALANILKDKDRLAVRDIERAEKLTNQFGLFTSPTSVISQYLVIKKELEQSIQDDLKVAGSIGILSDDIANYDQIMTLSKAKIGQQNKEFEKNITKIIESNVDDLSKVSDILFGNIKIVGEAK